jgi:hypothetical protein
MRHAPALESVLGAFGAWQAQPPRQTRLSLRCDASVGGFIAFRLQ